MKLFISIIFLVQSIVLVSAQIMLNKDSKIKDESGKILSFETWQALLGTNEYGLKEYEKEKGTFILYKFSQEEKEKIKAFMSRETPKDGSPMESPFFNTGELIASFKANDIKGNAYELSALKGKVVVLNFWFVGCAPCRQEIPELNEIVQKYSSHSDVVFLAIALDGKEAIQKMVKKLPFDYNLIYDGNKIAAEQYGVRMYPTHVILDKEGKVNFHTSGYSPETIEWLEKKIGELVQ